MLRKIKSTVSHHTAMKGGNGNYLEARCEQMKESAYLHNVYLNDRMHCHRVLLRIKIYLKLKRE